MAKAKISHLIVDMQRNGGGTEGNENLLASYLIDEPFQKYAYVSMPPKPYAKRAKSKGLIEDKWELRGETAYRGEFTLQSNYYSDLGYAEPDPGLKYHGKVYLLTSGVTFSGGAEFSSMLKMTNRATVVGEETGGAYEGNVSGYSYTTRLPHTRIKVSIPIVYFRINVDPEVPSRGVMPDHQVPQSVEDYLAEKNSKLEFVLRDLLGIPEKGK